MPTKDKYNCISLQRYNVYVQRSTDTRRSFLKSVNVHRVQIQDVDPYVNLTIGVSVVNNAGLESNIEEVVFVGSKIVVEFSFAVFRNILMVMKTIILFTLLEM